MLATLLRRSLDSQHTQWYLQWGKPQSDSNIININMTSSKCRTHFCNTESEWNQIPPQKSVWKFSSRGEAPITLHFG